MASIVWNNERYVQRTHAFRCLSCQKIVESTHTHDFKTCECGKVSVDGGITSGNSVLGDPHNMRDCSIWTTEAPMAKTLPQQVIDERHSRICNLNS
jgi:hypothetical protein